MNDQVGLSIFLAVVGIVAHVLSKWAEHREAAPNAGLVSFLVRIAPARTGMSALLAIGATGVLYGMDWLNPVAGFTAGWSANSMVDNLVKRTK